jgi:hypothetical protein
LLHRKTLSVSINCSRWQTTSDGTKEIANNIWRACRCIVGSSRADARILAFAADVVASRP